MNTRFFTTIWLLSSTAALGGCMSPYYSDQGALLGGLTGAGLGAIVGNSVGNAGAGAAIGAGVGALSGAVVGDALDEIDARNRAQIASQLGRPVQAGAVSVDETIAMSKAGVADGPIITHISNNGVAGPVRAADVIRLHEGGVSTAVIQTMQSPPVRQASYAGPPPVIIEERVFGPPPRAFRHARRYRRHYSGPQTSFGLSISN